MSSFLDYPSVRENHEYQEKALKQFLSLVKEGEEVPAHILRFVAQGIGRFLDGQKPWLYSRDGRPETDRDEFVTFACWFAGYCDPLFCNLPSTTNHDGRWATVADFLTDGGYKVSTSTARRRANLIEKQPRATDWIMAYQHVKEYASIRNWEWGASCFTKMSRLNKKNDYRRLEKACKQNVKKSKNQ